MTRLLAILLLLPAIASAAGLGVYNPAQHAVNGFMPTQLPGLKLWIEAGKASATNAGNVSFVQDFGVNGLHFTNTGGSKTPILSNLNGRPAILFDGVDDYFQTSGNISFADQQMSAVVCGRKVTGNAGIMFEHGENYNTITPAFSINMNDNLGEKQFMALNMRDSGYNICFVPTNNVTDSNFVYISTTDITKTATNESNLYLNGVNRTKYASGYIQDNANISGSRILYTGGRSNAVGALNFLMCETMFYNRVLSEHEITQVQRYLGTKYGIVVK